MTSRYSGGDPGSPRSLTGRSREYGGCVCSGATRGGSANPEGNSRLSRTQKNLMVCKVGKNRFSQAKRVNPRSGRDRMDIVNGNKGIGPTAPRHARSSDAPPTRRAIIERRYARNADPKVASRILAPARHRPSKGSRGRWRPTTRSNCRPLPRGRSVRRHVSCPRAQRIITGRQNAKKVLNAN